MYEFIIYVLISLVEFAIFYHYFKNFLEPKAIGSIRVGATCLTFSVALSAINLLQMGVINILAVCTLTVLFAWTLFLGRMRSIINLCIIVSACSIISEVTTDFVVYILSGIHFADLPQYSPIYFLTLLMSKSVLLIAVRIAISIHFKYNHSGGMYSVTAIIFPLASIMSIVSLYYMLLFVDGQKGLTAFVFCVSITMLVACLFVLYLFDKSVSQQKLQLQLKLAEQMIQSGNLFDKEKERAIHELQRVTHDFRKQIVNLQYMYQCGRREDADRLYNDLLEALTADEILELLPLENRVASAILYRTRLNCKSNHIAYRERIECEDLSFLSAIDTGAILDNLMDNALEACRYVEESQRFVEIAVVQKGETLVIEVRNSKANGLIEDNGRLLSTKENKELHGIGISSIRTAAQRYNGDVSYQSDETTFTIDVRLSTDAKLQKA